MRGKIARRNEIEKRRDSKRDRKMAAERERSRRQR
jgi:hypothetical protein